HAAAASLLGEIEPFHLVYFLLNVGDGDSQVLLLPEDPSGNRQIIVMDAAVKGKSLALIDALEAAGLIGAAPAAGSAPDGSIALVVATHPHSDHIGGIAELLAAQRTRIGEFWDPGYFHTTQAYHQMMTEVEANSRLGYAQPTAGYRRWFGSALVTVLSPAVGLRNRFDTYGTEINDSSLSLRVEFPAARVVQRGSERELIEDPNTMALVLGADAQTLSWSFVLTDFPQLHTVDNAAARAIKAATGADPLSAKVMKVSHHGSKHGINLELMERINPALTLVSSTADGPRFHFPHSVAQELIREARDPLAGSGATRQKADPEVGLFYTCDREDTGGQGTILGSMAVLMGRGTATLWRFGDDTDEVVDLEQGRRFSG
ncbi:MAG: ComEC/Rec2 family competence protein, partial [Acidimicrobiia bacterium]